MNLKKKVAHQPFSCELEGATTAVIFIHGILEGPYQFHGLAEKILDQGMSSFGILLPGHGGSAREFAKSHRTLTARLKRFQRNIHRLFLWDIQWGRYYHY